MLLYSVLFLKLHVDTTTTIYLTFPRLNDLLSNMRFENRGITFLGNDCLHMIFR